MSSTNRLYLNSAAAFALTFLCACDSNPEVDGGADSGAIDSGTDGGATTCAAARDCDNGMFCDGEETCNPGGAGAGPDGCVPGTPPCAVAACDESSDSCSCAVADMDGDGRNSIACGGDDCDDTDENRFPGNEEVCDAEGHDEDCVETTVGNTDVDMDTFIDAACCNTVYGTCGDDCNDSDINVNPGAAEACNGADDNCSGVPDDIGGICPGGSCVAGTCDFDAWDRVFGGSSTDSATAVAIDASGAVYVAGDFTDSIDFGAGERARPGRGLFVAKYDATGSPVWDYVSPEAGSVRANDLAVSPAGDAIYVVGTARGLDLGSGESNGAFLVVLNGAGGYEADRRFGAFGEDLAEVVADDTGAVAIGSFTREVDFGGGSRRPEGDTALVLARYDSAGEHVWDSVFEAGGSSPSRDLVGSAVAHTPTGGFAIAGVYSSGTLELGGSHPEPPFLVRWGFVAVLGADRVPVWSQIAAARVRGGVEPTGVTVGPSERIYVSGTYRNTPDFDPGTGDSFSTVDANGFVIGYLADGTPEWVRSFGSDSGDDVATSLDSDTTGRVFVVGDFTTRTDFGGGARLPGVRDGFLARYTATGGHERDIAYASGGSAGVRDVAVGPGNLTVIVGEFTSMVNLGSGLRLGNGGIDGFVLRLGS